MLGLLLYVILPCIIQLQVANCELQNDTQTSPATSTPTEMLTSTTVQSSTTMSRSSFTPAHSTPSPSSEQPSVCKFFGKGCHSVLLLVGGLIVACTILILSTLVLAWKVCLLSKRVSALSSSADLISQMECTRVTTVKKSSQSETELREGSVLVDDHLHEGKGGMEEGEEGTANEDKAEEAEEAAKREEASPAPTENSSNPAAQEEPAKADSTSEGTEKPKAEV